MIDFRTGDIFKSGADALVNPVNCVGVMGKGLALQFKKRYPDIMRGYKRRCDDGEMKPGDIQVWGPPVPDPLKPCFIVCVATKNEWCYPSRMTYIEAALENLRDYIFASTIGSIAMPALGCGLGGLHWPDVRERMVFHLDRHLKLDRPVQVIVYEPK